MYNNCDLCRNFDTKEFDINDVGDWNYMDLYYVYGLLLEEGKYYIGCSKNINQRIYQHFDKGGARWTRRYSPIAIVLLNCIGDEAYGSELYHLENMYTILYMQTYGRENVRGGKWTSRWSLSKKLHRSIDKYEKKLYKQIA